MPFTGLHQIGLEFFVLILFLWPLTLQIREKVVQLKLGRSGVKVGGHITGHRKERGYRQPTRYYLTYNYHYNGLTYSQEEKVPSDIYQGWNDGVRVSVSCFPDDPKTARLGYKIPASTAGKVGAEALLLIEIVVAIIMVALALGLLWMGYGIISGSHTWPT